VRWPRAAMSSKARVSWSWRHGRRSCWLVFLAVPTVHVNFAAHSKKALPGHIHSRNFQVTRVSNIMSATQFGLGLLYIAVAVICYAAGWWQGRTVERDRWEKRAAGGWRRG
jgi:hypothetical protein